MPKWRKAFRYPQCAIKENKQHAWKLGPVPVITME